MNCHSGEKLPQFAQFLFRWGFLRPLRNFSSVFPVSPLISLLKSLRLCSFSWVAQNLNHLSNFLISIASQCVRMIFAMCKNDKRLHFASAGCQFFLLLYQLLHTKHKNTTTQKNTKHKNKKTKIDKYKCRPSTCGFDTDSSHYDEGPNKIPQLYISSYFHNSSLLCLNFPQLQLRKI